MKTLRKNYNEIPFIYTHIRMAKIKKNTISSVGEDAEQMELLCCQWKYKRAALENSWAVSYKAKSDLTNDPAIPLLSI